MSGPGERRAGCCGLRRRKSAAPLEASSSRGCGPSLLHCCFRCVVKRREACCSPTAAEDEHAGRPGLLRPHAATHRVRGISTRQYVALRSLPAHRYSAARVGLAATTCSRAAGRAGRRAAAAKGRWATAALLLSACMLAVRLGCAGRAIGAPSGATSGSGSSKRAAGGALWPR